MGSGSRRPSCSAKMAVVTMATLSGRATALSAGERGSASLKVTDRIMGKRTIQTEYGSGAEACLYNKQVCVCVFMYVYVCGCSAQSHWV